MTEMLIAYYSSYGHIYEMAMAAQKSAEEMDDINVKLARIPELEAAREAMSAQDAYVKAQERQKDVPEVSYVDLERADGILWGIPTRFGNMPAQVKQFLDGAGGLWQSGGLEGTVTGIFTSSNTIHGGQETTIISSMIPMLHLGMILVGTPYGENPELSNQKFQGGSPYGASTVAGADGSRFPDEDELKIVSRQAARVARIAKKQND
ncbi:MAG: NAD(P)H:quinone oxidoreductase [Bacillota bacterium]